MDEKRLSEIENAASDIGWVGAWRIGDEHLGASEIMLALVSEVRRLRAALPGAPEEMTMDDANESEALVAYDRWLRSVTPSARTTIGAFFAGRKYATHAALPGAPSGDVLAAARRLLDEPFMDIDWRFASRFDVELVARAALALAPTDTASAAGDVRCCMCDRVIEDGQPQVRDSASGAPMHGSCNPR